MSARIEDYGFISDCYSAALVGRDGSIDWLCLPRYDSASLFGALLGGEDQGRWLLAPADGNATARRRYDGHTFTLVTTWSSRDAEVEVTDLMPRSNGRREVIRRVRGVRGRMAMCEDLRIRFDYANAVPWVENTRRDGRSTLVATAGPDAVVVRGPELRAQGTSHRATFAVSEGDVIDLALTWFPSHEDVPEAPDVDEGLRRTDEWWTRWADENHYSGPYGDAVHRSLLILRALTHAQTGGIVAAATTSLPEAFGGERNWDYRYVWLRDASLTISVLVRGGYRAALEHWRQWLLRSIAGDPDDLQIMYGISGERRLQEYELTSLPGYRGAHPARVGNAAYLQYQADVVGEVMLALQEARSLGVQESRSSWSLQCALMDYLERNLERKDQGLWETRGDPRFYTQSRVMIWAAFDCALRGVREFALAGPADRWERLREQLRAEIEDRGFDVGRNTYTQYYGTDAVDASLLLLPQVGYCAPDDPQMLGTVAAIERDLLREGLPLRYRTGGSEDGLPAGENPFLACAFWLAEQYARSGRLDDARRLMDQLMGYRNDLGAYSEEYDPKGGRQAGNTPQAFSHLALIRAARAVEAAESEAEVLPRTGRSPSA